jgi:uncharacterized membrane protein
MAPAIRSPRRKIRRPVVSDISKERVGALSDGVIAIAATLLVLELKVPEGQTLSTDGVLDWARAFAGWIVSFVMIAILWFENHLQMARASTWTVSLTVVTFVQLALLSLIPFGSSLIMNEPHDLAASVVFNAIMLANGLCVAFAASLLARTPRVHHGAAAAAFMARRSVFQLIAYTLVAAVSLFGALLHHPFLGVLLWLLMPVIIWVRFKEGDGAELRAHRTHTAV